MNFSHILSALAGIGLYVALQMGMDWIDRRGEAQVAQACVKQQVQGKWTTVSCAKARQEK